MSTSQQAMWGAIWTTLDRWFSRAVTFVVFVVLARLLEPGDFGVVALAMVYVAFLEVFVSQGLGFAIIQHKRLTDEHLDCAFWASALLGAALAGVTVLLSEPVTTLTGRPEVGPVLRWLALALFVSGLTRIQAALLSRRLQFKSLAMRNVCVSLAGGCVGLAMAFRGWGVWSLVGQQLAGGLVGLVVLWSVSDWRPRMRFSWPHFKELYSFGVRILGDQLVLFFSNRLDELLVGVLLGNAALGMYHVAKRTTEMVDQLILRGLSAVLMPAFAKIERERGREALARALGKSVRLAFMIAAPTLLGLAAVAPELVRVVFGEQWAAAGPVTAILAVAVLFRMVPMLVHSVLHATGRAGLPLMLNISRAVLTAVIVPVGLLWQLVGVAAGMSLRSVMGAMLDGLAIGRAIPEVKLGRLISESLPTVICCVPMMLVVRLVFAVEPVTWPVAELAVVVLLGALTYVAGLMLVGRALLVEFWQLVAGRWRRRAGVVTGA